MRFHVVVALLLAACDGVLDEDGDGSPVPEDCADTDPSAYPGAVEVCDDVDNNCDGTIDEPTAQGASAWWADRDGDGFGDPTGVAKACDHPIGFVDNDGDCDDGNGDVHPDAIEVTGDGVDNDCDPATAD